MKALFLVLVAGLILVAAGVALAGPPEHPAGDPVVSDTPTDTPSDTPTDTPTDTPSDTPTDTSTDTPSDTPTDTPGATDEPTATDTPEATGTPEASDTPTDSATGTNTPTDTPTGPADTPTSTHTHTPTPTRTATVPTIPLITPGTPTTPIATSGPPGGGPTIRIGSVVVQQVGAQSKVSLDALGFVSPGLSAWTIDVHFDPVVVELHSPPPLFAPGVARVGGAAAIGRTGQFVLASIQFQCLAVGETDLTLEISVLRDGTLGDPQPIDADLLDGHVFCGFVPTATPTAVPTTPRPSPTPTSTPGPGTPTAGPVATPTPAAPLYGDANCNGVANAIDGALILQLEAGLLNELSCEDQADVNGDLQVDSRDAALLLQYLARLLPSLPA